MDVAIKDETAIVSERTKSWMVCEPCEYTIGGGL